jgi:cytochrome P450
MVTNARKDYWIDGKLLPKGATIMTNLWELHHDEKRYANPDVFDPDHYAGYTKLAPEYLTASDPVARDHYAYGNGRRVCPGIHLGERNIFLGICKLLWAFEFKKAVDENGNPIETDSYCVQ